METIVKMLFGSDLYGTCYVGSDHDYKGIFMPAKQDILLGRVKKSITLNTKDGYGAKNTANDTDTAFYSLPYFIDLACRGETVALDMLHAPANMILESSTIWQNIVVQRHLFYTKSLSAFMGYALRQAAKYGIKGSRLADAEKVIIYLSELNPELKMRDVWDDLPEGEHICKGEIINNIRHYELCSKKIGETATVGYALAVVTKFRDNYGTRAKQAMNNEGVDFKAVSHALRAAYEVKEILTERTITFPLRMSEFLTDVKLCNLSYPTQVSPVLEALIEEVKELSVKSTLPEKVDREYWDGWLVRTLEDRYWLENSS